MLYSLENVIESWIDDVAQKLAKSEAEIIGFTVSHQQTNAAISLINRIKKFSPQKIIIVGGSNCDGNMAKGILSLSNNIDYIFSGKSEKTLRIFIENYIKRVRFKNKIISSYSVNDLDELPIPCYDDYFEQIKKNGINLNHWLNVESSRGCWWGFKRQCKFCGVNGSQKKYKSKSANRIIIDFNAKIYPCPLIVERNDGANDICDLKKCQIDKCPVMKKCDDNSYEQVCPFIIVKLNNLKL